MWKNIHVYSSFSHQSYNSPKEGYRQYLEIMGCLEKENRNWIVQVVFGLRKNWITSNNTMDKQSKSAQKSKYHFTRMYLH